MKLQRNGIEVKVNFAEANAQKMAELRLERNIKLAACDWTQLPGVPITAEQKTAWDAYRQALRDITDSVDFSKGDEIDWPVAPN